MVVREEASCRLLAVYVFVLGLVIAEFKYGVNYYKRTTKWLIYYLLLLHLLCISISNLPGKLLVWLNMAVMM